MGIGLVCLYYAGEAVYEKISGCIQSTEQIVHAVSHPGIVDRICHYKAGQACDLPEQDVPFCEDGLCTQCQSGGLSSLWENLCVVICGIDPYLRAKGKEKPCDADPEEQVWNISGICSFPDVPVLSGAWNGQSVPVL